MERKIKNQTPAQILVGALKSWKIRMHEIDSCLGVSHPTALRLLRNPDLLSGTQRSLLAAKLNLPVDIIDDLVNGKFATTEEFIETVSVPPLKKLFL